ncbi:MAG: hypothetical protein GXY17_11440 [Clostridiaceae bacterium]|nr:hypothetical protein [Clostridiaceae bacterium]
MKKTQKILGLPVVSISDGLEVGKVKSIIINADRGAIDYIVVDSGIQIFSARVIPMDDVLGIGEYALTIENEGVITDISRIPEAIQLLQNDIKVKGTKVLTKKGRLIGEIGDIYIDEDNNCKITGLEFIDDITQKQLKIIPRDTVITFGKNLTVVKEDIEASLLDTPSQLDPEGVYGDFEKKNNPYTVEAEGESYGQAAATTDIYGGSFTAGESVEYESSVTPEVGEYVVISDQERESTLEPEVDRQQETVSDGGDNASMLYEQRQRQYLNGRYATRTITDNEGNVIISEGMMIDDGVIDEAKSKDKLIELVMNNKA